MYFAYSKKALFVDRPPGQVCAVNSFEEGLLSFVVFAVTENVYFVKGFNWVELHVVDFEVRRPGIVGLTVILYSSKLPSRVAGGSH